MEDPLSFLIFAIDTRIPVPCIEVLGVQMVRYGRMCSGEMEMLHDGEIWACHLTHIKGGSLEEVKNHMLMDQITWDGTFLVCRDLVCENVLVKM